MPSHPDRVRRNYEEDDKIKFKGIPIHVCSMAPDSPPGVHIINTSVTRICPFCGKELECPTT